MAKTKTKAPSKATKSAKPPTQDDPPLRLEWLTPADLAENPANWRTHPTSQVNALTAAISEVGWAGACLYNERTKRLIDGHARKKVAVEQGTERIPVLVGNWTDEQEKKILATLDPLAAMAEADKDKLEALLKEVATDDESLNGMLRGLAVDAGLPDPALPEAGGGGDEFDATPAEGPTRANVGDLWLVGCYFQCDACGKEYDYEVGKKMNACPCG